MLLDEVNVNHEGTYDFFYLPIDFKNKCNVGYCFINFLEAKQIPRFVNEFNGQRWRSFNSEKVCAVSFARIQGKQAMISRFQNSSLLEKDDEYRPLLFYTSGPERGQPEPFPLPSSSAAGGTNSGSRSRSSSGATGPGGPPPMMPLMPLPQAASSALYSQQQAQQAHHLRHRSQSSPSPVASLHSSGGVSPSPGHSPTPTPPLPLPVAVPPAQGMAPEAVQHQQQ
jgi:hypothetical protein